MGAVITFSSAELDIGLKYSQVIKSHCIALDKRAARDKLHLLG
jgi:hypothetical protein